MRHSGAMLMRHREHPRCATSADCGSEACSGCELCQKRLQLGKGTPGGLRCEAWCTPSNCKKDACFGCKECAELHPNQAKAARSKWTSWQ